MAYMWYAFKEKLDAAKVHGCSPHPVDQGPASPSICRGGNIPKIPAEVAEWYQVVVCVAKVDKEGERKGANKKEKANLDKN